MVCMMEIPTLYSLCVKTFTRNIMHGFGHSDELFELPPVFLDNLLMILPPLALQNIYELSFGSNPEEASIVNGIDNNMRCGRYYDLNTMWETLHKKRWTENINKHQLSCTITDHPHCVEAHQSTTVINWQQLYWEGHLQECLNAATEQALLPAFDGNIAELETPDGIMSSIGHTESGDCNCSKLLYHCIKFGRYARCVKLQSILCRDEIFDLLRTSKLEALVLRRILSGRNVDGVCKLISQNMETLVSIELSYCKLSPLDLAMICCSVFNKESHSHGIKHFSIKSSIIFGSNSTYIPTELSFFLLSGRSLHSVCFADTHMGRKFAEAIFETLLKSSSSLVNLELSGNELEGWLTKAGTKYVNLPLFSESCDFFPSLIVLNLRGNNLNKNDMAGLLQLIIKMPKLLRLDLSDNPIGDDGMRTLIPFFITTFGEASHSSEILLENCELSGKGVCELLQSLLTRNGQVKTLSLADNDLGSSVAAPLANLLSMSRIRDLNIEGIGLETVGFMELGQKLERVSSLAHVNISKNRGGMQTALFIFHIVSQAPDLVSINAGFNLMPPESLPIIQEALRKSNGKLEQVDLTGNTALCSANISSVLSEFQFQGKPIIILPSFCPSSSYDDDP